MAHREGLPPADDPPVPAVDNHHERRLDTEEHVVVDEIARRGPPPVDREAAPASPAGSAAPAGEVPEPSSVAYCGERRSTSGARDREWWSGWRNNVVRWEHPTRGLLTPDRFLPIVEDAGLEPALFTYVLEQALDARQQWATGLGFRPPVSVNLSPRQLHGTEVVTVVDSAIARRGLSPGDLWLEVTETAVAHSASAATLFALHHLGVRLATDDFGTGWSPMARLASFPWDVLKIDRSFIAELAQDTEAELWPRSTATSSRAAYSPALSRPAARSNTSTEPAAGQTGSCPHRP